MIPLEDRWAWRIRNLRPMLADRRSGAPVDIINDLLANGDWRFELKVNGHRALVFCDDGEVTITTREGSIVTDRFPEVRDAVGDAFPARTLVLDGELVCLDSNGRPSLSRMQRRASRTTRITQAVQVCPASFIAFDVLFLDGEDLRSSTYVERTYWLGQVIPVDTGVLQRIVATPDGMTLWRLVRKAHLEGVVAKRAASVYSGVRSPDWLKLKE
jgi:bifunctional non-homologous end joining protein LigD